MKFNNLVLGTVCALLLCSNCFARTAAKSVPVTPVVKKVTCVDATSPLAFFVDASGSMMKKIKIEKKNDAAKVAENNSVKDSVKEEEKKQEEDKELTKAAFAKQLILSVKEKMKGTETRMIGLGALSPFTIIYPKPPEEDPQDENSQKGEPQKAQNEGILYEHQEDLLQGLQKDPQTHQREKEEFAKGMEKMPDDLEIFGRNTNLGDGIHEMTEVSAKSEYNRKFSNDLEKGIKIILFTDGQKDNYGVELRSNLKKFQEKYPLTRMVFVVFHEKDEDFDRIQLLGEDAHIPVYKGVELLTDEKALSSFLSKEINKDCK